MPRGRRGTGKPAISRTAPPPLARHLARDLIMDLHTRIITQYDMRTIVRMMEQRDTFGFIVPRSVIPEFQVPVVTEEMDYTEMLRDPQLTLEAIIYQSHDAVMVKHDPSMGLIS